ncbi:hypothetical protein [Methanobrevibacter ruminantium]|nr:hypothetical protein [Methanobrevibacter ruminantium]
MNESYVKRLYRDLGIPYYRPKKDKGDEEFDFFPKYDLMHWIPLKV